MANLQISNNKNIQNIFFSKENISLINNSILETNSLQSADKQYKMKIVEILIKNMKIIFKSLDTSKITQNNINSIKLQFNKLSGEQTFKEMKSTLQKPEVNSAQLKFERDFRSKPNSGNKLMDRPIASSKSNMGNNFMERSIPSSSIPSNSNTSFLYPPGMENADQNNFGAKFDNLFKRFYFRMNLILIVMNKDQNLN